MIDHKTVANITDATWNGYVRARFLKKALEVLETNIPYDLYREIKVNKKVKTGDRMHTFVTCLDKGEFIGRVAFNAVRVHFGD